MSRYTISCIIFRSFCIKVHNSEQCYMDIFNLSPRVIFFINSLVKAHRQGCSKFIFSNQVYISTKPCFSCHACGCKYPVQCTCRLYKYIFLWNKNFIKIIFAFLLIHKNTLTMKKSIYGIKIYITSMKCVTDGNSRLHGESIWNGTLFLKKTVFTKSEHQKQLIEDCKSTIASSYALVKLVFLWK